MSQPDYFRFCWHFATDRETSLEYVRVDVGGGEDHVPGAEIVAQAGERLGKDFA